MNKYTDVKYFTTMQEIVEFAHANNMTEDWKIGEDDFGRGFYLYTFEEEKSTDVQDWVNSGGGNDWNKTKISDVTKKDYKVSPDAVMELRDNVTFLNKNKVTNDTIIEELAHRVIILESDVRCLFRHIEAQTTLTETGYFNAIKNK